MSDKLIYLRIEEEIRNRIASGVYPPGSQLPTEKELVDEFQVSRGGAGHPHPRPRLLHQPSRGRPGAAGGGQAGEGTGDFQIHQSACFGRGRRAGAARHS